MGEYDYNALLGVTIAMCVFLYWRFRKADCCDGDCRPQLIAWGRTFFVAGAGIEIQTLHFQLRPIPEILGCEIPHEWIAAHDLLAGDAGPVIRFRDCLHQNHIFRIRANRARLDPRYFAFVVESDIAKRYFNRVAKRTTNLASTNKTQVRAFRFPLPPLNEQAQIAEMMAASKTTMASLKRKAEALQQLKKSLMHDLLTGTVRVNPALFPSKAAA